MFYSENVPRINNSKNDLLLNNVFNTSYKKKALVSFLVSAFNTNVIRKSHTNNLECFTIAEILHELEYSVDVVNYDDNDIVLELDYDLIIGFGQPIENFLYRIKEKHFNLILYRNGTSQEVSDILALDRISEFQNKNNILLVQSARIYPYSLKLQHYFADKLIVLGNSIVKDSYSQSVKGLISNVNLFYYDIGTIDFSIKDFSAGKFNFLWFGSSGALHKGLDLVIEFFAKNTKYNLFIAGLSQNEIYIRDFYKNQLTSSNIVDLGFIDIENQSFKDILYKCNSIISPTISEGGGGALLNVIAAGGLIPIVTNQIGLDFKNSEIMIDSFNSDSIEKAISNYLNLTNLEIKKRSIDLNKYIRKKHTFNKYKNNLRIEIEIKNG